MRIMDEIGPDTRQRKQLAEQLRMPVHRMWSPDGVATEPSRNAPPRLSSRGWARKHPRVRHYPQEAQQTRPWQSNAARAAQLLIEPVARRLMLRQHGHCRIDQDIGINQNQRNASPSTSARSSAMLSMLATSKRPLSRGCVRNGFVRFAAAVMSRSPRRKASLTMSLSPTSIKRRKRSSSAATSSSIVKVVRMHHSIIQVMT